MDEKKTGTPTLKTGLAEMLKGGVIMDVVNAEQGLVRLAFRTREEAIAAVVSPEAA